MIEYMGELLGILIAILAIYLAVRVSKLTRKGGNSGAVDLVIQTQVNDRLEKVLDVLHAVAADISVIRAITERNNRK